MTPVKKSAIKKNQQLSMKFVDAMDKQTLPEILTAVRTFHHLILEGEDIQPGTELYGTLKTHFSNLRQMENILAPDMDQVEITSTVRSSPFDNEEPALPQ